LNSSPSSSALAIEKSAYFQAKLRFFPLLQINDNQKGNQNIPETTYLRQERRMLTDVWSLVEPQK
jgi:hypothetical protein